jgi:hypothetical protein
VDYWHIPRWILFYGIWRGMQQKVGRVTGNVSQLLRSSLFYFLASAFFFGMAYLGWKPLPWDISPQARGWMLTCGSLLFFPGMAFLLWARLTLGKYYFVSTVGAQFRGPSIGDEVLMASCGIPCM